MSLAYFANSDVSESRYALGMMNRISEIREIRGLSQVALAEMLGIHVTNLNKIERGKSLSSLTRFAQIARILDVPMTELFAAPSQKRKVALMGYVGAGGHVETDQEQVPPEGLDEVELPFDVPEELDAYQVRGTSMFPRYDDGDVILVWKEAHRPIESFVGEEVMVYTTDGKRYLKQLVRSGKNFDLYSWNAHPILNVKIRSVGEIYSTIRAKQLGSIRAKAAKRG